MLKDSLKTQRRFLEAGFNEQQATSLVSALQEADEQLATKEDLERMHREIVSELSAQFNQRFDQMNAQFNQRFDQMNAQFNDRLDQMNAQSNERFDRMNEQMRVMMRWTVGAIVIIGAIITVLLTIAEFT